MSRGTVHSVITSCVARFYHFYHPISLLSVCYKLLERLALQRISPTVEGLLSPDQASLRKGRSTCDQVAALTTFIENGFQQNLKTGAVFLDLTAAYDE